MSKAVHWTIRIVGLLFIAQLCLAGIFLAFGNFWTDRTAWVRPLLIAIPLVGVALVFIMRHFDKRDEPATATGFVILPMLLGLIYAFIMVPRS